MGCNVWKKCSISIFGLMVGAEFARNSKNQTTEKKNLNKKIKT
jgi:hypothetical protein